MAWLSIELAGVSGWSHLSDVAPAARAESRLGLQQRFKQYLDSGIRDAAALDSIIVATQAALDAVSADDEERHTYRNNLAVLLRVRFELAGNQNDVDRSIELLRQVLHEADGAQIRQSANSSLALSLLHRYIERDDPADLEAATAAGRDSLAGLSSGSPAYPKALTNLAAVLRSRFVAFGNVAELAEMIRHLEIAIATEPIGGNDHQVMRIKLGEALMIRGLHAEEVDDLAKAVSLFQSVIHESPEEGVNQQLGTV